MPTNEGPTPATAEGPEADPLEHQSDQPSSATPAKGSRAVTPLGISQSQSQALGSIAAGASTVFLLGTLATVLFNLFPLQFGNFQWVLGQMANLVANGSWLLLGLVLLHLAALLQPNNARLGRRLVTARRLAGLAAVIFLALTPLQLVATWNGLTTVDNSRSRVVSSTAGRVKLLREAIVKASDLADLKQRARSIPNAPPIPAEAANLPFETLRRTLLGQLDVVEANLRRRLDQANPRSGQQAIWRQAARDALTSLLLALGFASGAEGRVGKASLLASLLSPPKLSLPRQLRLPKLTLAMQRGWQRFSRSFFKPNRSGSKRSRSFTKRLAKNWQLWGLRFWEWRF